jgi:exopolysaccharide production protein ExoQ
VYSAGGAERFEPGSWQLAVRDREILNWHNMARRNPSLLTFDGRNGSVAAALDAVPVSQPVRIGMAAWCVAAMLTASLIAMVHDPNYANARGQEAVEEGRGVDDKTAMDDGFDAAALGRVVGFGILLAAGAYCFVTRPRNAQIQWDGLTMLIVLALAWTLASWGWSAEPGKTWRELLRLLSYFAVAAALALRFDLRSLCFVIAAGLAGSVGAAVAFEIATGGFNPWLADYRLSGSLHSNILAVQAAVVALIAFAFALQPGERVAFCWAVFTAALTVVLFTRARTALATVIAGAVAIQVVRRPSRKWLLFALTAAPLLAGVLVVASGSDLLNGGVNSVASMGRSDDKGDFTGRLPLWSFVWEETAGHRLEGFGWGAFWLPDRIRSAFGELNWFPRHAHNAYLQIVVNLGLVGLVIAVAIGLVALRRAALLMGRTELPEYSAILGVLVGIFINGVAESAFVMPRDMGLFAATVVLSLVVVRDHTEWAVNRFDRNIEFVRPRRALRVLPAKGKLL